MQILILIYNESPITYNIDGINIAPLECESADEFFVFH